MAEQAAKSSHGSKVTLTNWKRLTNVPANVNLSGVVQPGVHWREYLVFLDHGNKQLYLYHIKIGVWSALFSTDMCDPATVCPLAVYDQDLILLSSNGVIYKYFMESGHWKVFDKLNDSLLNLSKEFVGSAILASISDQQVSLFLLCQVNTTPYNYPHTAKIKCLNLRRFQNSRWFPVQLNCSPSDVAILDKTVSNISYAIVQSNLYVNINGSDVYCINTQNYVSKIPALTSLTKTTICSVKDTMFSFGGQDIGKQPSSDVSCYNPHTKEWEPAGYMRTCRYSVFAVPLLRDDNNVDIFVVGGKFIESADCKVAEKCEVNTC